MRISICRGTGWETVDSIVSFILHNQFGEPTFLGIEYRLPEGTAWTMAGENEKDFYKILTTSGVLLSRAGQQIPRGVTSLLCTPELRKGVPRCVAGVFALVVKTDADVPMMLTYLNTSGQFERVYQNAPDFRNKFNQLWANLRPLENIS